MSSRLATESRCRCRSLSPTSRWIRLTSASSSSSRRLERTKLGSRPSASRRNWQRRDERTQTQALETPCKASQVLISLTTTRHQPASLPLCRTILLVMAKVQADCRIWLLGQLKRQDLVLQLLAVILWQMEAECSVRQRWKLIFWEAENRQLPMVQARHVKPCNLVKQKNCRTTSILSERCLSTISGTIWERPTITNYFYSWALEQDDYVYGLINVSLRVFSKRIKSVWILINVFDR